MGNPTLVRYIYLRAFDLHHGTDLLLRRASLRTRGLLPCRNQSNVGSTQKNSR